MAALLPSIRRSFMPRQQVQHQDSSHSTLAFLVDILSIFNTNVFFDLDNVVLLFA